MNVKIGAEAAQFPGKEYINRIFLAVREKHPGSATLIANMKHEAAICLGYSRMQGVLIATTSEALSFQTACSWVGYGGGDGWLSLFAPC
jgi:hypothetical protein